MLQILLQEGGLLHPRTAHTQHIAQHNGRDSSSVHSRQNPRFNPLKQKKAQSLCSSSSSRRRRRRRERRTLLVSIKVLLIRVLRSIQERRRKERR